MENTNDLYIFTLWLLLLYLTLYHPPIQVYLLILLLILLQTAHEIPFLLFLQAFSTLFANSLTNALYLCSLQRKHTVIDWFQICNFQNNSILVYDNHSRLEGTNSTNLLHWPRYNRVYLYLLDLIIIFMILPTSNSTNIGFVSHLAFFN